MKTVYTLVAYINYAFDKNKFAVQTGGKYETKEQAERARKAIINDRYANGRHKFNRIDIVKQVTVEENETITISM